MEKEFEFLEHTADLEFASYGETLSECFENAALAFFTATLKLDLVETKEKRKIELVSDNLEILMHDWLNELLFLFEVEFLVFREFKVDVEQINDTEYRLTAEISGEQLDLKKHKIETEIKAVTYHNLSVEKKHGLWKANVLCDI